MVEHFPELIKDTVTGNTTYTMKDEKNLKTCTFGHMVLKQQEHQNEQHILKAARKKNQIH